MIKSLLLSLALIQLEAISIGQKEVITLDNHVNATMMSNITELANVSVKSKVNDTKLGYTALTNVSNSTSILKTT